jgi:hypothetical protein
MEPSIWGKFLSFVKTSFTQKFKAFMPGCVMGFVGSKSLLFSGLPAEMVTLRAYVLKYAGTVFLAFGSGLATSFAAYLVDRYKEKKSPNSSMKMKKRKSA